MRPTDSVGRALSPRWGAGHTAAAVRWRVAARPSALLQGRGRRGAVGNALLHQRGKAGEREGNALELYLGNVNVSQNDRSMKTINTRFSLIFKCIITPFTLSRAKAGRTRNKISSIGKHHLSTGKCQPLLGKKRGPRRPPVYKLLDNKELTKQSRF